MNYNRRDFLKKSGLATLGLTGIGAAGIGQKNGIHSQFPNRHRQEFNMHGYAAPAIDLIRVGIIGMGGRGNGAVSRLNSIEGTEIKAICDVEEGAINAALDRIERIPDFDHPVETYYGSEDSWKELCDRDDIDLVIVTTPWHLHAPMCIYSMERDKHVATEIPAAQSLEECWALVETSERTKKHCMMMENVCYGEFEMVTLNMARNGFFGDIIHGEGAYIHQLMTHNFSRDQYHNMWRYRENAKRNGNLYPMHGLGTVAQIMEINYGDQMKYMVSVSSDDFMMKKELESLPRRILSSKNLLIMNFVEI